MDELASKYSLPLACCAAWLMCSSFAAPAEAASDDVRQCIVAHAEGQKLRGRGALKAAKEQFSACKLDRCPRMIRDECEALAAGVEAAQPSVVLVAMTEQGQSIPQATVVIDSSPAAQPLHGAELVLDPGRHEFTFTLADGKKRTIEVVLREGEKQRRIEARFPSPPEQASQAPKEYGVARPHPIVYGLAGVGALALGSWAFFALDGRTYETRLDQCSPHCTRAEAQANFDRMRARYLAADISLSVAAASIGLGAYFLVRPPHLSTGATRARAKAPAVELSAAVAPGSMSCVASGRF